MKGSECVKVSNPYLARRCDGKVDWEVGKSQNTHERNEPSLGYEFATMIVGRVVAQYGVHELHNVKDVIH